MPHRSVLPFLPTALLLLGTLVACDRPEPGDVSPATLLAYWRDHPRTPREYVVDAFDSHRWVFLGEYHRVKHDLDLLAAVIPQLHRRTEVRRLAWEFLCRDRTEEANRLVTAETYDREATLAFFRSQFPSWAYEEYLEVFHAIWASNRESASERGPFLMVGLHPCIDWETVHYGEPEAAAREKAKQERYDAIMAEALERDLLEPGIPALIVTGIAHATGKFREYWVGTDRVLERMGNLVYREPWRDDMFFIALHAPFFDAGAGEDIYPFDGILDRMMAVYDEDIGFDIVGTPFAGLRHAEPSEHSITAYSFGELFDGYILFRTPLKETVGVTCIDDWIVTEEDFRYFWRHLANAEASRSFSEEPFETFRAEFCAPRPDHGVEFARRFRKLPDLPPL